MTSISKNTGLTIAIVIVAGGLLWYFFGGSGGVQAPLTATSGPNPVETQFLTLTSELSPISFNSDVFSDPRFQNLKDISTPVTQESTGRTDPFAPFGSSGSSGASNKTTPAAQADTGI